jgi:PAS domain S-box-containing protein
MTILIVDDIQTNRKLLRAILQAEGHGTLEAADGVEALAVLGREKVDAVISDILMPNMDGFRLCHEIRTSQSLRHLPVIIYTSTYTAASDEKLALDLGADKYLKKPASTKGILAALDEVLARPRSTPNDQALNEVDVLKEYSQRLVAKLEEKCAELSVAVDRYDDLFDNAHDFILCVTPDGHFLYVNRPWRETLGYAEAEVPALTILDTVHPDGRTRFSAVFQRLLAGERMNHIEAIFATKVGEAIVVNGTGSPRLIEGKSVAVRFIFRDVTERKRAESALEQMNDKLHEVSQKAAIT